MLSFNSGSAFGGIVLSFNSGSVFGDIVLSFNSGSAFGGTVLSFQGKPPLILPVLRMKTTILPFI